MHSGGHCLGVHFSELGYNVFVARELGFAACDCTKNFAHFAFEATLQIEPGTALLQQSLTHDQIEAMTLADRIVVLRDGHIEQVGTPLELYDNPANAFVGTFLGSPSMSLFAANVMPNDPMRLRLPDGDEIRLPHPANRQGAVSMGIRPESFRLVEAGAENALAADVVVVEPTGSMTEIVLRKGGLDFVATFPERVDLRPGQPVHLSVASKDVRIFEAEAAARPAP